MNPFLLDYPSHIGFTNPERFQQILDSKYNYIKELVTTNTALKLGKKNSSNYIIFAPSIKGYNYQITYFINDIPFSDCQFNELNEVIERISSENFGNVLERIGGIN